LPSTADADELGDGSSDALGLLCVDRGRLRGESMVSRRRERELTMDRKRDESVSRYREFDDKRRRPCSPFLLDIPSSDRKKAFLSAS